jgi:hypothetical protein
MNQAPPTRHLVTDRTDGPSATELQRQVSDARLEVEAAYKAARQLVYDRLPIGPIDRLALTEVQRAAIARLEAAEQRLRQARRASHTSAPRVIELD